MSARGVEQGDLAQAVGCSQGAISQILTGRTSNSRFLPKIAFTLGVSLPWLLGTADTNDTSDPPIAPPSVIAEQLGLQMIPEVDIEYSMGGGSVVEEFAPSTMVPFRRDWLQRLTKGVPSDVFLTRGRGDSMMPTILDGDDVLVNRAENRIRQADEIWAVGYGELGMIKRVRRLPNGSYELNSDNQNVRPINATEEELFVVGRVIWVGRRI
jgi:phage repressor protein C with HTH and peptisase S24 domain